MGVGGFLLGLGPRCGGDFGDLVIGQMREAGEDVAQVGVWIEFSTAEVFEDREEDALVATRVTFT